MSVQGPVRRAAATAALLAIIFVPGMRPRHATAGPEATAAAENRGAENRGAEFTAQVGREIDDAIRAISARERDRIVIGARPVEHVVARGPGGLVALAYARETPDGILWPILVLRGGGQRLAVVAALDFLRAFRIDRMEWGGGGAYLAVLTQSDSLAGPGGQLAIIMVESARAKHVDDGVFSFTMSRDGRHLVYQRAKDPANLHGPREIVHSDGVSGERRVVAELDYPTVQLARLGALDAAAGRVPVKLRDYTQGLTRAVDVPAVLDLTAGKLVRTASAPEGRAGRLRPPSGRTK
jgi:hypothetical protein